MEGLTPISVSDISKSFSASSKIFFAFFLSGEKFFINRETFLIRSIASKLAEAAVCSCLTSIAC